MQQRSNPSSTIHRSALIPLPPAYTMDAHTPLGNTRDLYNGYPQFPPVSYQQMMRSQRFTARERAHTRGCSNRRIRASAMANR